MPIIKREFNLKELNTFHMNVLTHYFTEVNSIQELLELQETELFREARKLILGGGSNVLFTGNYEGLVIKNNLKGIEVSAEDEEYVYVKSGAGENWHNFVLWNIEKGFSGLENLSLIPGNVGASPMQNIGAYGVEIKDVFEELEAVDMETGDVVIFKASECEFGYRESVFKRKYRERFFISNVTFRMSKNPRFNTSYGAIEQELEKAGVKDITIRAISDAVIRIRSSKLPSPQQLGNAGSFFKNPEVPVSHYQLLKKQFPQLVAYPVDETRFKLAAGWLIENSGWKGRRIGDAGVHHLQALVLVNHGSATGKEIFDLSQRVMNDVKEKF
jgi:UDP-N-acetylmuramate dehydrogenase